MLKRLEPVTLMGSSVPWGGAVIHFYYSPSEQVRLANFIAEATRERQAAVLACTFDAYQVLVEELRALGVDPKSQSIIRIEVTANLRSTIYSIAAATSEAAAHRKPLRVLVDFGSIVPQENIFEAEAAVSTTLKGLRSICITQYDGRAFPAPVTIEQFRTHALAIVGNVLYHENRTYTRPENYYRMRAASGRG